MLIKYLATTTLLARTCLSEYLKHRGKPLCIDARGRCQPKYAEPGNGYPVQMLTILGGPRGY